MWAGFGGLPNSPRLKLTVAQTRFEGIGAELLRHQSDLGARGAIVAPNVVTGGHDRARGRV